MIRISWVTPVSTVGATNLPGRPGTSVGPPQSLVAPAATASSISSTTISYWSSEVIGPISVSHWIGSPSRSFSVSAADARDEALGDGAVDVDALDPRAGLAGVGEAAPDGAGDRVVEVGVGADDHRVLAAELEHRALEPLGADRADLAADLDRAGEEDLADARLGERVADRAAAVDDADQALGQAALLEDAADRLAEQRRQAGRLEDDAVAGHQRDRDLAEGDRPGVVPGRDHADDADRLVGEAAFLARQEGLRHPHLLVGEDLRPGLRAPVQGVDGRQQLHRVGLDPRLALLVDEQLGDLVDVVEQRVGGAAHVAGAVLERQLRPGGLDPGDVVDDPLDLVRSDRRNRADELAGGGVERLEGRSSGARLCGGHVSDSTVAILSVNGGSSVRKRRGAARAGRSPPMPRWRCGCGRGASTSWSGRSTCWARGRRCGRRSRAATRTARSSTGRPGPGRRRWRGSRRRAPTAPSRRSRRSTPARPRSRR